MKALAMVQSDFADEQLQACGQTECNVHLDQNRGQRSHRVEIVARRRAVSLVEVVATVLIVSIISAIAVPRWGTSLQQHRLKQAASRIVADLTRAQEAAFSTSTSKVITFTIGTSQYGISGLSGLDNSTAPYIIRLGEDPYHCQIISVWGYQGTRLLTFDGYGLPDQGGNIVIGCGQLRTTIAVDPGTGTAVVL